MNYESVSTILFIIVIVNIYIYKLEYENSLMIETTLVRSDCWIVELCYHSIIYILTLVVLYDSTLIIKIQLKIWIARLKS